MRRAGSVRTVPEEDAEARPLAKQQVRVIASSQASIGRVWASASAGMGAAFSLLRWSFAIRT